MTICTNCKNKSSYDNRCLAYPLPDEIDPVTGFDNQIEAYEECRKINKGNCRKYTPKD